MNLQDIKTKTHLSELNSSVIRELQTVLKKLGYSLNVDGIYGPETLRVFNQFKTDYSLTQPNYIGSLTVTTLLDAFRQDNEESEPKPDLEKIITNPQPTTIDWTKWDQPVSKYFTVGEVSRYDRKRIVYDRGIQGRVIKLALELDEIREELGVPIGVTSWYRPPSVNRAVGGARFSQHLTGGAVDIYPIQGMSLLDFQSRVDEKWYGAFGYGASRGFAHLDMRNHKGWKSGGNKGVRWNY